MLSRKNEMSQKRPNEQERKLKTDTATAPAQYQVSGLINTDISSTCSSAYQLHSVRLCTIASKRNIQHCFP